MRRPVMPAFICLGFLLAAAVPAAAQVTVFDGTFSRLRARPVTDHATFAAMGGQATMWLDNGGADHALDRRVSAALIRLNGRAVFEEMQFNQDVTRLEAVVDLLDLNDLEVLLEGRPGATVAIRIVLPPEEDLNGIRDFWQRLADLFATSQPSDAQITAWFEENVAPDFVDSGAHYQEMLDEWLAGGGPVVGMTFSLVVTRPLDLSWTTYARGYEIRLDYTAPAGSGSLVTAMVFDGSRWLWYGDQQWVETGLSPAMNMTVDVDGSTWFETGLGITLWDYGDCTAYQSGARSAIVTGPGLPEEGTKLYHMYPLPYFRLYPYNPQNPAGDWYVALDDATILTIPDGAKYTVRLYSESPDTVSLASTPLTVLVKTNAKRPLLSTEMNASWFPALLAPLTHKSSELNVGGVIDVSWTNPETAKVGFVGLGLMTATGQTADQVGTDVTAGETSVSLDTSAFPGYRAGQLALIASDDYGRGFMLAWRIYPWN